jgi:hypothetical protein
MNKISSVLVILISLLLYIFNVISRKLLRKKELFICYNCQKSFYSILKCSKVIVCPKCKKATSVYNTGTVRKIRN